MFSCKKTIVALLLFFAVMFCGYYNYQLLYKNNNISNNNLFFIAKGSTVNVVAHSLKKNNLICSENLFKIYAFVSGKSRKIQAGEYNILPHSSIIDILKLITSGCFYQHSFVNPEGLTVKQVIARLQNTVSLVGSIKQPFPSEGSLMPTSLNYLYGTNRNDILKRLIEGQKKLVEKIWQNRDKDIPLKNSGELLVLASIIEKESSDAGERPLIASVFYNRLAKHMKLQSDPTVIYARYGGDGKPENTPIYYSDLRLDSPYNTYKIFGLPPSPIANPGYASLYAAAHPAKTDYLFFMACDKKHHVFNSKLVEHNKAVKKFRNI